MWPCPFNKFETLQVHNQFFHLKLFRYESIIIWLRFMINQSMHCSKIYLARKKTCKKNHYSTRNLFFHDEWAELEGFDTFSTGKTVIFLSNNHRDNVSTLKKGHFSSFRSQYSVLIRTKRGQISILDFLNDEGIKNIE